MAFWYDAAALSNWPASNKSSPCLLKASASSAPPTRRAGPPSGPPETSLVGRLLLPFEVFLLVFVFVLVSRLFAVVWRVACADRTERSTVFFSSVLVACVLFWAGVKMPLPSLASTSALASRTPAPPLMSWAIKAAKVTASNNAMAARREKIEGCVISCAPSMVQAKNDVPERACDLGCDPPQKFNGRCA